MSERISLRAVITSLEDCGSQYWAAVGGRLKRLSLSVSEPLPPIFTEATGKLEALQELTLGPPCDPEDEYPFCPGGGNVCLRLFQLSLLTVTRLTLEAVELDCPKLAELHLDNIGFERLSGPGLALRMLEIRRVSICIEREGITECELFPRFPLRSWHGLKDLRLESIDLSICHLSSYEHVNNTGSLGDLSSLTGITSLNLYGLKDVVPSALPTSLRCLTLTPKVAGAMTRFNPACLPSLAGSLQQLSVRELIDFPGAAGFWRELTNVQKVSLCGAMQSSSDDVHVTLPQLKTLSLHYCQCQTIDIDCPSLVSLRIEKTRYVRLSVAAPSLRSLRILDCLQDMFDVSRPRKRAAVSGAQLGSEGKAASETACEPAVPVAPFHFQLTSLQALQLLEVSVKTCHPESVWLRGEAFKGLQQLTNLTTLLLGSQKMVGRATPTALPTSLQRLELNLKSIASQTGIPETVDGLSKLSIVRFCMPVHMMVVLQRPLSPFLAMPGLRILEFLPADEGFPIDWDDDTLRLLKEAAAEIKLSGSELKLICPGL